jgi:formate hydrogenlyase subunit 6/NADH:ubiquinone oxidoreductase subunit I
LKVDYTLSKAHLSYWLRQIRKTADLIAPLRSTDGDIVFSSVENIHEIVLDSPANLPSPKEFLFPQKEEMFRFSPKRVESMETNARRVIFGVRSCDISAALLMDKVYGGRFADEFYSARRENTVFISIACNKPEPSCFCIGLGTGPFLKEGFDIQLTDLGDRYLVQVGSQKGRQMIKGAGHIFKRPKKADYDDQYEANLSCQSKFEKRITLEGVRQKILAGGVPDSFWEAVASRCFQCGGCVYQCPVCTCFNVVDWKDAEGDKGVRIRLWDGCMFKGFTKMAGNVWPAEKMAARTKRWYYHKLVHWPEHSGRFGCVGCGRCAITCPGKIDMATVANKLEK